MIKPLYFPNIYINRKSIDTLGAFFKTISVFDVTGNFDKSDDIEPPGDERIDIIHLEFDDEKNLMEYLLNGFNSAPLYDAEHAAQVGVDLLKMASDSEEDDSTEKHLLLKARLFLYMAETYDVQTREINSELADFNDRKQSLLKELQGLDNGEGDRLQESEDIGDVSEFQVEKRIEAWSVVFEKAAGSDKVESGFFITDIAAVMDHLIEFESSVEHVTDIAPGEYKESEISEYVQQLVQCDWPAEKDAVSLPEGNTEEMVSGRISLYIIPKKEPVKLFSKFAKGLNTDENTKKHINDIRNTVIGFVEM